ncbi:MAG: UbiD family decarboxylase, partial [Betaproteobacteria bacterium]|nr:UbiD family decarboxylase [Betaproteobacteria bacterium]
MSGQMGKVVGELGAEAVEQGEELRMEFAYEDLRGWIEQAEKLGELRRVKGASWQEDIGMAAELV